MSFYYTSLFCTLLACVSSSPIPEKTDLNHPTREEQTIYGRERDRDTSEENVFDQLKYGQRTSEESSGYFPTNGRIKSEGSQVFLKFLEELDQKKRERVKRFNEFGQKRTMKLEETDHFSTERSSQTGSENPKISEFYDQLMDARKRKSIVNPSDYFPLIPLNSEKDFNLEMNPELRENQEFLQILNNFDLTKEKKFSMINHFATRTGMEEEISRFLNERSEKSRKQKRRLLQNIEDMRKFLLKLLLIQENSHK